MGARRKRLEDTAKLLRSRLSELRSATVNEHERPMHEVAVLAVRQTLTQVGHQLARLAVY